MADKKDIPTENDNTEDDASIIGEIKFGDMPPMLVRGSHNRIIYLDSNSKDEEFDVFISYARADAEIVQGIYESLVINHRHPWMDIHSLKGGEEWLGAINKAIEECEIFLAVLSNNSVSRRGIIQKELKKALDKWEGMLPGDIYIIPIRIDDCPIPDLVKHIQVLDWNDGKGGNKLLKAINVGLARRKTNG
jgi:hypothetical protein